MAQLQAITPSAENRLRSDGDVRGFYAAVGARLLQPVFFTEPVRRYLDAEACLLGRLVGGREHLIEVGCGSGRYRNWAAERGKHYDGIDLVSHTRQPWAGRAGLRSELHLGSGEALPALLLRAGIQRPVDGTVILPFNCIGNMADPDGVLSALASLDAPIIISGFRPSAWATARRLAYYRRCGLTGLSTQHDWARGVLVTAIDGLHSLAYRAAALRALLEQAGLVLEESIPLGRLAWCARAQRRQGPKGAGGRGA